MTEIKEPVTKVEKVFIERKAFRVVDFSVGNIRHVESNDPLEIKFLDESISSKELIGHNFDVNPDSKIEIEECIYGGISQTTVSEFSTRRCKLFVVDMKGIDKPKKMNKVAVLNSPDKGVVVVNRSTLNDFAGFIFGHDISATLVTRRV